MTAPDDPVLCLRGVLPATCCADWLAQIDAAAATRRMDPADEQPTSGSLRLQALGNACFDEMLAAMMAGAAGAAVHARLGADVACLRRQCWVRRQYPAALRPAGQAPHAWHQDGALHARFDASGETLIDLVTVWMPLVDCGADAPSLEWIDAPALGLLQPPDLVEAVVTQRHSANAECSARLGAGDALVFGGNLLHRTHVTPAMTLRRISVEWRFVAVSATHQRLAGEPLLRCSWKR